jgi:hypothetical protein
VGLFIGFSDNFFYTFTRTGEPFLPIYYSPLFLIDALFIAFSIYFFYPFTRAGEYLLGISF